MSNPSVELKPIEVMVKDHQGGPVSDARVRATYNYSGLSADAHGGEEGKVTVPLLYCDNEPMRIEAVAPGYQAEAVGEYQPNKESFELSLTLLPLESEWEQITIPISRSNKTGAIKHPTLGSFQINGTNFHIHRSGDVSVNGSVSTWHHINLGQKYDLLMKDGTETTIRFLEMEPQFSVTLEFSPPKQHNCVG